jgi:hypothetical protein
MKFTHTFTPTTDNFSCRIIRVLGPDENETDGVMYEIGIHAYADELVAIPLPDAEGEAILDRIENILYPLDEPRGHQWNGGDVCDALAELLASYRPTAYLRQPEEEGRPTCDLCERAEEDTPEMVWNGTTGNHVACEERVVAGVWDTSPGDCPRHDWHWGFASLHNGPALMTRYCRCCGYTAPQEA